MPDAVRVGREADQLRQGHRAVVARAGAAHQRSGRRGHLSDRGVVQNPRRQDRAARRMYDLRVTAELWETFTLIITR